MFDSSRVIFTPSRTTNGGNLFTTEATRFCTLSDAWLGSVPKLKTTCMVPSPSLPASEAMYFMPGTPLSARSSGKMADFTINSLLAPGYSTVTFTLGGEIEGNCVTGKATRAKAPMKTIINEMTIDNTGLCINLLNMRYQIKGWTIRL